MAPAGVSGPGNPILDPDEELIRRGLRGKHRYFIDQITGKPRLPAAIFEPRLPELQPRAKNFDEYLSVNIASSLAAAGEASDWGCDHSKFYAVSLMVGVCHALSLGVTWEPIIGEPAPTNDNPHHGGIRGVVELFRSNIVQYDVVITKLAEASEVLPQCLAYG